ncbi:MAG TPA: oligosaccharide flippase family protein [Stellaceae bacterium]|nr:oligosaccharide flippase family protein [Stellaceae bacterium]
MTPARPAAAMRARRLLGAGSLASLPWIADFATRFFRTVILAHFLSPRELGFAVALNVLLAIAWLLSDLGIDQFLMSRPPGDGSEPLAAAHSLHLAKGIVISAAIWAAAPAIAPLFGAAGHVTSFRWCAVILLVHAFAHQGVKQAQRDFRYLPEVKTMLLSRGAGLAIVYPAVLLFHDHRAMIASLLVSSLVATLASHLFAQARYRLTLTNRRILREAVSYGLPLIANGLGIAVNSQLDRALVSYWLGLGALAAFAVILNLAVAPISVALGILTTVGLPFLAQTRNTAEWRGDGYVAVLWLHGVIAAAYSVFVAAMLGALVPWVYGPIYQVTPPTQALIALLVWVRLNRGAPTLQMLAAGDTGRLMAGNLVSGCGLVLAALALSFSPHLETALAGILFGDTLSLAFLLYAASRRTEGRFGAQARELCWSLLPSIAAAGAAGFAATGGLAPRLAMFAAATAVVAAHALLGFRRYFLHGGLLAAFAPAQAPAGAPPSIRVAVDE